MLMLSCACFLNAFHLARTFAIETVVVGNPGNAPDQVYPYKNPDELQFGTVDYVYRIGTYEVTNAQYAEFLNAKAKSDALALYSTSMGSSDRGGIVRTGTTGNYEYTVKSNMDNKPVNFVNWYDAARFTNWMNNGKGSANTEDGTYTLLGGTLYPENGGSIVRNPGATWFLPTENEWYKAAYYDPRTAAEGGPAGDDHYWLYPTRSDTPPTAGTANSTGDISNPGANVANHSLQAIWNGLDGSVTTVGSAGPLSSSYYGTYDQGGNVWEVNEQLFGETGRGVRGGAYDANPFNMPASLRHNSNIPTGQYSNIGFRVALALILGDANGDVLVDGADYTIWADHFLLPGVGFALGDFNMDGVVNGADYTLWADNVTFTADTTDTPTLTAAAVPEPSAIALAAAGTIMLLACGARHRRARP
jgi:formylglycine-generating enzyme required for sulfatase activity